MKPGLKASLIGATLLYICANSSWAADACRLNFHVCQDNAQMANEFGRMHEARYACGQKLEDVIEYGKPDLPFLSFHNYTVGDEAPKTGVMVISEPRVKIQNAFGAMRNTSVRCQYDFNTKRVTLLMVGGQLAFLDKPAARQAPSIPSARISDTDFNNQVQTKIQAKKARKALVPATTNEECISLIRVAAMADAYVRQCSQKPGISQAAMDHYSHSSCYRITAADEINITRKQVEFDSVSDFNREGAEAYCREAGEFYGDKAEIFGLR